MLKANVGDKRAHGAVRRVLAGNDVDRGTRTTRKLSRHHQRAAGLRDGKRGVLAPIERRLDNLGAFSGIQLCGNTMDEQGLSPFNMPAETHANSGRPYQNPPNAMPGG